MSEAFWDVPFKAMIYLFFVVFYYEKLQTHSQVEEFSGEYLSPPDLDLSVLLSGISFIVSVHTCLLSHCVGLRLFISR